MKQKAVLLGLIHALAAMPQGQVVDVGRLNDDTWRRIERIKTGKPKPRKAKTKEHKDRNKKGRP